MGMSESRNIDQQNRLFRVLKDQLFFFNTLKGCLGRSHSVDRLFK